MGLKQLQAKRRHLLIRWWHMGPERWLSLSYFCRWPKFGSQHPHDGSQQSGPRGCESSSTLCGCPYRHSGKTWTHIKIYPKKSSVFLPEVRNGLSGSSPLHIQDLIQFLTSIHGGHEAKSWGGGKWECLDDSRGQKKKNITSLACTAYHWGWFSPLYLNQMYFAWWLNSDLWYYKWQLLCWAVFMCFKWSVLGHGGLNLRERKGEHDPGRVSFQPFIEAGHGCQETLSWV